MYYIKILVNKKTRDEVTTIYLKVDNNNVILVMLMIKIYF